MSDLASSNGRTPNFDFGNSGSTPLARTTPTDHAKKLRALVPACDDPADYTSDDRVMLGAADAIEAAEARAERAEAALREILERCDADREEGADRGVVYAVEVARAYFAALTPTGE